MDFSPEALREHFWKLTVKREAIDRKLDPLREKLNKAGGRDMTEAAEAKLRQQIRDLQNELAPIENERAAVARALGGQTGERPK